MTDRSLSTHRMNLAKALSEAPTAPDDVLPGLPVGTVGALVAPGGTGKTMFAFGLAVELACGKPWLRQSLGMNVKQACVPQPVAMVVAEESEAEMHRRLWRILESMLPAGSKALSVREEMRELLQRHLCVYPIAGRLRLRLDEEGSPGDLKALSTIAQGKRMLILDPLRQLHGADENSSSAMTDIVQKLQTIATRQLCAVLVCHHANKLSTVAGTGHHASASRGAGAFTDAVRWQVNLSDVDDGFARRYGLNEKQRALHVRLDLAKANYIGPQQPAVLRHSGNGALVPVPFK